MRLIAELRIPFKKNGLRIQNGILMPNVQDNDKFGELHSFTLTVKQVPDELEVRSVVFFSNQLKTNNGFTAMKHFNVKKYSQKVWAIGGERMVDTLRMFVKNTFPIAVGDEIYTTKHAIARYYQTIKDAPEGNDNRIAVYIDDVIAYKKLGEKSLKMFNNFVIGQPHQEVDKLRGTSVMNLSLTYSKAVTGLFKDTKGRILVGYGQNHPFSNFVFEKGTNIEELGLEDPKPFSNFVDREGSVKKMYYYPETSFYGTFRRRGDGYPEITPLPNRFFIAFDEEETMLMISQRKPMLSGTVVAGEKWVGRKVVYDLFMHPFEFWKDKKRYMCVAVMEENVIALLE